MEYNYYKILGLTPDAGIAEIKRSFRDLAKKYHPDKNFDPSAPAFFLVLKEAYKTLSDPELRAKYDNKQGFGFIQSERRSEPVTPAQRRAERRKKRQQESTEETDYVYRSPNFWEPPNWVKKAFYFLGIYFGGAITVFSLHFVFTGEWPFIMLFVPVLGIAVLLDSFSGLFFGHTLLSFRLGKKVISWFYPRG